MLPLEPIHRNARNTRIALVVLVAFGLVVAKWLGVLDQIGEPSRFARALVDLGAWGYLAFVLAFAFLQPFGLPGTVFIIAAPLIWPWPVAYALSMTGTMACTVVGFSFARFVARDWVSPKIPARFRKYNDALARRAFATVFFLRLVFLMPPFLHAFFGVSKVRASTHYVASFAAYLLPLFMVSFFGQRLVDALRRVPMATWIQLRLGVGSAAAVLALAVWAWRRHCAAR